jgi:hypothetical protein
MRRCRRRPNGNELQAARAVTRDVRESYTRRLAAALPCSAAWSRFLADLVSDNTRASGDAGAARSASLNGDFLADRVRGNTAQAVLASILKN